MGSPNIVVEDLAVCDFRAIGKKFEEGLYTSLVSVCTHSVSMLVLDLSST